MTTTINLTPGRHLVLPEDFCRRHNIEPGTALRVTEVGTGFYVSPVPEPSESELRAVLAVAGSLSHEQTSREEALVESMVGEVRSARGRRK